MPPYRPMDWAEFEQVTKALGWENQARVASEYAHAFGVSNRRQIVTDWKRLGVPRTVAVWLRLYTEVRQLRVVAARCGCEQA